MKPISLLLVDDDVSQIFLTKLMLEETHIPHRIKAISLAQEALDYLQDMDPNDAPDLILLDIMIPEVSGLEILADIRSNPVLKETPVVLLTSQISNLFETLAESLKVVDYLQKPLHKAAYVEILDQLNLLPDQDFNRHLIEQSTPNKVRYGH